MSEGEAVSTPTGRAGVRTSAAIVLAGGRSRRLGRDKTAERIGGRTLLDRVVDALADVERVVLVGPSARSGRVDVAVCEDPPGSGPVAALAAGLAAVDSETVFLLSADLPFLTATSLAELAVARTDAPDAAVAVAADDDGRVQFLLAMWPTALLRAAVATVADPVGARLAPLYRAVTTVPVHLTGWPPPWWDCDTEADLALARQWAEELRLRE